MTGALLSATTLLNRSLYPGSGESQALQLPALSREELSHPIRHAAKLVFGRRYLACQLRSYAAQPTSFEQESHEDFQPKIHGESPTVKDTIEQDIREHPVFVYMKGHPDAPMCGFSNMVVRILDSYGVRYGSRNVLEDNDIREGIKKYTSWPTIP